MPHHVLHLTLPPVLVAWSILAGCSVRPVNPSFPISDAEAEKLIDEMEGTPRPLDRPVVVLAGWADPGFADSYWENQLEAVGVPRDQIVDLTFIFKGDFDRCRDHVIEAVQAAWPSENQDWTVEVDVVAFSMGGLVARYSAAPRLPGDEDRDNSTSDRRLRIHRLFTISTPHRGAVMAGWPTLDHRVKAMRADSVFLAHLDEAWAEADYILVPYTRLDDWVVGSENTAPPGTHPWWVDCPPLHRPHQEAYRDPRIGADILRRLRGEPTLTQPPAVSLPPDQISGK